MQLIDKPSTDFSTPPIWETIRQYFDPIPLYMGPRIHWRTRAKLAVRGSPRFPKIGLFKPGTHDVEDLTTCPDHHPSINEALHILRQTPLSPYDEKTLTGNLRYVQLTTSRVTKKVQLVLVSNGQGKCDALAEELSKAHDWHSIWINTQEGSTNTIFGPHWAHHSGPKYLEETLLNRPFYFHPACFMQANIDLFEKILLDIRTELLPQRELIELYAGVGIIGLTLADRCSSAHIVENNPFAKECFEQNNPPSQIVFHTGFAEKYTHLLKGVLIVDPPRKGLDRHLLQEIKHAPLEQIIYLSCNFDTLKRDLEILKEASWGICNARGYDLFPHTNQVELLVNLRNNRLDYPS